LFRVIPHGAPPLPEIARPATRPAHSGRLKILVLGSLALNKGRDIVTEIAPELRSFADLFLLGAGPDGEKFAAEDAVTVIDRYHWPELPSLVASIDPDVALLPSLVPETFSYTLQELFELKIPVLATRLGSFVDRIEDGLTGFLCEPSAGSFLERLRYLHGHRHELDKIRDSLNRMAHRSVEEMLQDYRGVLQPPSLSPRVYFCDDFRARCATGSCRVSWRATGQQFISTPGSVAHYLLDSRPQRIELKMRPIRRASALRLDICDRPGIVIVRDLRLSGPGGSELCRWDIAGMGDMLGSNLVALHTEHDTAICALDEKARLELLLPPAAQTRLSAGGRLAFEISCLSFEESLELLTAECAKKDHPRALDRLLHRMQWSGSGIADSGRISLDELDEAQRRIRELESSLSWRVTKPLRAIVGRLPVLVRLVSRITSNTR